MGILPYRASYNVIRGDLVSIPVGAFITLICLFIIMLAGAMGSAVVSIMALLVIFLVSDKVRRKD